MRKEFTEHKNRINKPYSSDANCFSTASIITPLADINDFIKSLLYAVDVVKNITSYVLRMDNSFKRRSRSSNS